MPNNNRQLDGHLARLQSELARALGANPIKADLVEHLVREVADAERLHAVPDFETTA